MNKSTLCVLMLLIFFSKTLFAENTPPTKIDENPTIETSIPTDTLKNSEYAFPIEDVLPPQTDHGDRFFTEMLNMLAVLGFIIALIFFMGWFLKRMLNTRIQQMNVQSPIKILESRTLTPKTTIYLVEIHGKGIALAESQNGIAKLAEFDNILSSPSEELSKFGRIFEEKKRQIEQ